MFKSFLFFLFAILSISVFAAGGSSFAGANNYYVASLPKDERITLLDAMKDADMKVLRTWVTGHGAGQKASSNAEIRDPEADGLGKYNDELLDAIDQLMVEAHERGIKLLIGMHDKNVLESTGGGDAYTKTYGKNDFYTSDEAIKNFNARIDFILSTHKNALLDNRPWSELGDYIFGYEPQNEPMIFDQEFYKQNLDWICNTAAQIRDNVNDTNQLIFTGGSSAGASVQDRFFDADCKVDVVEVHDYTGAFNDYMPDAISKAKDAGKKILVGEWGSEYKDGREGSLEWNVGMMDDHGIPWLYWQLITNEDPHQSEDYEIAVNGESWSTLQNLALGSVDVKDAPFDWSASLP